MLVKVGGVWGHFTLVNSGRKSEVFTDRSRLVWDVGNVVIEGGGIFHITIIIWVIVWKIGHSEDFAGVWVHNEDRCVGGGGFIDSFRSQFFDALLEATVNTEDDICAVTRGDFDIIGAD